MPPIFIFRPKRQLNKAISLCLLAIYLSTGTLQAAVYDLPRATEFIALSTPASYPVLRGIEVDPNDPFHLKFIVDSHNREVSKEEVTTLIRYFLGGLTIPEEDLWVNLSPYEQDQVISTNLSHTDLGKELLAQDYTLKQLSSSLTYPETQIGKAYWKKLYEQVYQLASTTNIPINTYNKVWIVPDKAEVYENKNSAFITEASLTAMHEEDYLALKQNNQQEQYKLHQTASRVMKEVILPHIDKDINQGENFAKLRQIYHSLILAAWFKQKLKDSVFKYYLNQEKISGIDLEDKSAKEKIYQLYLEACKKGVYDYIKTDYEPYTNLPIKRKYFSGGVKLFDINITVNNQSPSPVLVNLITPRTELFDVRTAVASSGVISRDFLKDSAAIENLNGAVPGLRWAEVIQDQAQDKQTWRKLCEYLSANIGSEQKQIRGDGVGSRDDELLTRLTQEGDDTGVTALKFIVQELGELDVSIGKARIEAIIRAWILAGFIKRRNGDPPILNFLPEAVQSVMNNILGQIHVGIAKMGTFTF